MNNLEEIKRLGKCTKANDNKTLIECPDEIIMGHSLVCFLEKSLECPANICIQFNFKETHPRLCFWMTMSYTKTFMEIEINETSLNIVNKGDGVSVDFTAKVFNALTNFLNLKSEPSEGYCHERC